LWEEGTDRSSRQRCGTRSQDAGVKHFVWSTLPDVEAISGGKFHVPHFTGKAKVDRIVKEAGFANHTFVIAPFYYQNLIGVLGPQKQADGSVGWALPLDPTVRCIHMAISQNWGNVVAGAFAHPDQAGHGEYLPLVGDFMSFNEIIDTLNRQGYNFSFNQSAKGSLRGSLSWGRRDSGNVRLLSGAHVLGFRFARPSCARRQNRRPAADKVLGVGSSEFPGCKERPLGSTVIGNERKSILAGADKLTLRGRS